MSIAEWWNGRRDTSRVDENAGVLEDRLSVRLGIARRCDKDRVLRQPNERRRPKHEGTITIARDHSTFDVDRPAVGGSQGKGRRPAAVANLLPRRGRNDPHA
jgi:hypothetical protein